MITFVTINIEGEEREWNYNSIEELSKNFWTSIDIPSNNDPILSCEFRGTPMYFNNFLDLITVFGINNEEDHWKEN